MMKKGVMSKTVTNFKQHLKTKIYNYFLGGYRHQTKKKPGKNNSPKVFLKN